MKKLFTLLLLLCVTSAFAQQSQDTLKLKHFSTWAIAPSLSVPFQYMDIEPISASKKLGFGLNIEKHLSHYTSFQVAYNTAPIYSTNEGLNYEIRLSQWDARFYLHLTNGHTLRNWSSTQLYLYGGLGRLSHKSDIFSDTTDQLLKSQNGKATVALIGGGAKYRLGNRTALFLDGCANFTSSDKLDATKVNYTFNDGYFRLSAGISYTLGKKKIIEWDNPYHYLVPEVVHDTTVVLKTVKYEAPPKPKVELPDSATIYFMSNSASMEVAYLDILDSVLEKAIQSDDDYKHIKISAYCDTTGSDKANKALVEKRADTVAEYVNSVIKKRTGVDVTELTIIELYDESAAVYAPDARNRKVIVSITR